ncbi:phage tail tape measure protein [Sphingomonas sp. RIT328]|uniref:phage tail tape measure protein n=1 Tax=Sphingomonas sp. RIT328 TaxID=1470591 RepID=UPI000446936E|nr:phage tail tape measure protein [Sphingomonas sp. RIT328]EZP57428.1 Phage tail tape measure protein, TP901 family, core region [Sphingomonas sp. RIT328]
MQALLASLVVSMGVKDEAYKAGMSAARAEAKKTQQDFDKSTDGMAGAVERTAKRVNEAAVKIADSVAQAGQKVRTTGLALTAGLTLGLGGMAKVSKDAASDFQAAMNGVHAALINASPEQLDKLRDAALSMGPAVGRSATEAAGAIEALAKNGMSAAEILAGGLKSALTLAVVGQTDLNVAADATTDIIQQFGKTAADLPEIVDKVTGALDVSKMGMDDYRLAIGQVGGVAGGLGYSFDDMNTALAATASYFQSGSDAGTSFKTFLTTLNPQSKEAERVLTKLGVITKENGNAFFTAAGQAKPLAEIAEVLRQKFGKLSDRSLQDAMTTAFGTDAMRTGIALMKEGAAGINEVQASIEKVTAGQKMAVLLDGEAAATQRLAGAWEKAKIAIGDAGILQAITLIKNTAATMINAVAGAPPWFLKLGVAVGAVAAATGPMILVMLTLAKVALPLLLLRLGPIALGFAALINPVGVVIRLLAQLALQAGASAMLQALGTRLLALAGPIGLAVSLLTLLAPLMFKTAEASQAAKDAATKLDDANSAATDTATRLATATGKARDEILGKAKADRVAAAAAIANARANLAAARAELARAQAQAPKQDKSVGGAALTLLATAGFDPTLILPRTGRVQDAKAEVAQRAQNAAKAEANFRTIDDAINGAEAAGKPTKIDMGFDDPKKPRTKKTRDTADDAARNEAAFQDELGRSRVERLQAEADLTDNARTRFAADVAALEEERASYIRQNRVDKDLTDAQRASLLAAKDQVLERRRDVVQQTLTVALAQEGYDLAKARNDAAQEQVRVAIDAADSVAVRRDGELRLLDLQQQQEEADLDLILATKATGSAEWSNAAARKDALKGVYDQRRAATMRGNETSAQTFMRQMNMSGDALKESVEDAGVGALHDLNTELSDAILGAKSLGDAFTNMGRRIVGSLLDIAIQQAIIKPLANSLFGAGGGGGVFASIGNFFASSFGGARKNGGGISAGKWYNVGENGPERFYPGISGTVVPNDGGKARGAGNTQYIDMRGAMVDQDVWGKVNQIATARAGEAYRASAKHTESTIAGVARQRL